jgi:RNA polymerase sigma-70 factor, ECF subfamily
MSERRAASEGEMTDDASAGLAEDATQFEPHRRYLSGLAYRMLGSVSEAQDVVQDAFLRWSSRARDAPVASPRAYLTQVVTRLCLDRKKAASAQREAYVGTWLPEPLVTEGQPDLTAALALADDLSVALLVTLETLSPLERAAFLLHDVFEMDFDEIAAALDRSAAAVRQLATRARAHVREGRPRFEPSPAAARIVEAFHAAATGGQLHALAQLLAEDAVFYSDGGGKRAAALKPIYGKAKILRFLVGVARKRGGPPAPSELRAVTINGAPGYLLRTAEGVETLAFELSGEQVVAIYAVRNPDKLRHLQQR